MQKKMTFTAALSALAIPAVAATAETPYALSAVHADLQGQFEEVARQPGEIGAAARAAADLMGPHSAEQERLVLPLLGWANAARFGGPSAPTDLPNRMRIEAEMTQLYDGDVNLVAALADLYAVAVEAGDLETARLAERTIWHENGDTEVLYPAALLVIAALQAGDTGFGPMEGPLGQAPLYGAQPVPMMSVGNPHEPGIGN